MKKSVQHKNNFQHRIMLLSDENLLGERLRAFIAPKNLHVIDFFLTYGNILHANFCSMEHTHISLLFELYISMEKNSKECCTTTLRIMLFS